MKSHQILRAFKVDHGWIQTEQSTHGWIGEFQAFEERLIVREWRLPCQCQPSETIIRQVKYSVAKLES
jgi:hypothetical protein